MIGLLDDCCLTGWVSTCRPVELGDSFVVDLHNMAVEQLLPGSATRLVPSTRITHENK